MVNLGVIFQGQANSKVTDPYWQESHNGIEKASKTLHKKEVAIRKNLPLDILTRENLAYYIKAEP